jgi:transcription initiation factor TFIIIB Brf1 subunit/transcription initiation factor TFIIB
MLPDRESLIRECGGSIACIHAADYYVKRVQDPCYPPAVKRTTKVRKYLMRFIEKYGAPECDVERLVVEKLRGTKMEDLSEEVVKAALAIKKKLNVSSPVAAALATYIVALRNGRYVTKKEIAAIFKVSEGSLTRWKVSEALKVIAA